MKKLISLLIILIIPIMFVNGNPMPLTIPMDEDSINLTFEPRDHKIIHTEDYLNLTLLSTPYMGKQPQLSIRIEWKTDYLHDYGEPPKTDRLLVKIGGIELFLYQFISLYASKISDTQIEYTLSYPDGEKYNSDTYQTEIDDFHPTIILGNGDFEETVELRVFFSIYVTEYIGGGEGYIGWGMTWGDWVYVGINIIVGMVTLILIIRIIRLARNKE